MLREEEKVGIAPPCHERHATNWYLTVVLCRVSIDRLERLLSLPAWSQSGVALPRGPRTILAHLRAKPQDKFPSSPK